MAKLLTVTPYLSSAERRGLYYRVWSLVRPPLVFMIRLRPGALGLCPPQRKDKSPERYRDEWVWWKSYLWHLTRRSLGVGRGELIAVCSVALATWLLIIEILFRSDMRLFLVMTATGGSSILIFYATGCSAVYVAYVALKALPPDEYAKIALAGKTSSEIFRALAYEGGAAARSFLDDTKHFSAALEALIERGRINAEKLSDLRDNKEQLHKTWSTMKDRLTQFGESIERLIALVDTATKDLGISKPRLCDHVLQYSPEVHRGLATSYIRYCEKVLQGLYDPDGHDKVKQYTEGCLAIQYSFRKRVQRLERLFDATDDLHAYLRRIFSEHSTSGAVIAYSEAVSFLIRTYKGACVRDADRSIKDNPGYRDLCSALTFLHRKQQAHPGFDVHYTCLRILEEAFENKELDDNLRNEITIVLNEFRRINNDPNELRLGKDIDNRAILSSCLDAWERIESIVERQIDISRQGIKTRFVDLMAKLLPDPQSGVVITHGYSKTVREALMAYFVTVGPCRLPKTLALLNVEEDASDARRLVFELRERLPPGIGPALEVTIGDKASLGLLSRGENVVVVLGAECYDGSGRIVHVRGAQEELKAIAGLSVQGINVKVVVVAENYKRVDPVNKTTLMDKLKFFRYHLNKLDVYGPGTVDYIVSDKG